MEKNTNQLLNRKAAAWYARLRAPDCSLDDRQAFDHWLKADPSHQQAYRHAERVAALLGASHIAGTPLAQRAQTTLDLHPAPGVGNAKVKRYLQIAALALFTACTALLAQRHLHDLDLLRATARNYSNSSNHESRVVLEDGSVLHLDVGSSVAVKFSSHARELVLQKGRAYFEVAHDASKPFSVDAAGTRTVALGTRFEVCLQEGRVQITLAQGSVAITPTMQTHGDGKGDGQWREVLAPGQQLRVAGAEHRHELSNINAERVISWSSGRLVFDGEPLQQALEQFNRYTDDKVVLGDESLAQTPIGGDFVAGGDSMEFVAALTSVMPLRSERVGDHEIVLFQKHGTE